MRLTHAKKGQTVKIKDLSKAPPLITRRLLDLGIMEGTNIVVINIMPFGGPIMIECNKNRIAIRLVDAEKIEIDCF